MGRKYKSLSRRIKIVPNLHKLRSTINRKYRSTKNKIKKTKSTQSTRKRSSNKYKKIEEKYSDKHSDADIIIKSVTPKNQIIEGKKIYLEIKKNLK